MGADELAENTPKCPKTYLPKLSTQAQKFGISMKKGLHWASVVHGCAEELSSNVYSTWDV